MGHKVSVSTAKGKQLREQATAPGMSDMAASEEACRRWGESGVAWHPYYARRGELRYCQVGGAVGEVRDEWQVFGVGRTWEQAFADATARGH